MVSEDFGRENEKKQRREPSETEDFACFGEYGSRWNCEACRNAGTCKNFSRDKQKSIYLKAKMKYHGKGKWRRKDLY